MKKVGIAIFLLASLCCAQESGGFQAASTDVWGTEYRGSIAQGEYKSA